MKTVRSEMENVGLDQLDLVAEEVGLESSSEGENTDQESEDAQLVDEPVSVQEDLPLPRFR